MYDNAVQEICVSCYESVENSIMEAHPDRYVIDELKYSMPESIRVQRLIELELK